ncbi:hypothetical protein CQW37_02631 [Bacteroides fragilis]|nr:hypothetical protein CQW37_02631 [Bacteroides fragilis]
MFLLCTGETTAVRQEIPNCVLVFVTFAKRKFMSNYGISTYAENPHMDENDVIEKAIRKHSQGQDSHVVGEWLALTASKIGKLPAKEAERAERTAFQIAHHLDMDEQQSYGMKR